MAVTDTWVAGGTFTADDEDDVARAINGSGWLQPCHYATLGTETFTVSSGSVTQITGTVIDGGSPGVNDRILIKDAPASTGTGSAFSNNPGNGIYQVTANSTNLTVSRVYEMSASPPTPYVPSAEAVSVMAGTANAGLAFIVTTPNSPAAFTYGTGSIQWSPLTPKAGTGLTLSGSTLSLSSGTQTSLGLANSSVQNVTAANGSVTIGGTATAPTVATNTPSGVLKGNGTGGFATATAGTDYTTPDGTETLTHKTLGNANTVTLKAVNFTLQDSTDTTKQAQFLLSSITTATTRNFTLPDADDTLVGLTATQALTHKNLTDATNAFPTLNQNTTGSAAKWTTARNLAGNSADGSANVAFSNKFVVQGTTDGGLSAAQFLGALSTGLVKNTTATGVLSIAVSGTDYAAATSGTSALKANGAGGFANATLNDVGVPTGSYSMGGFAITSLGAPSSSTDAATKGYVDTLIQGLSGKYSALAATNTETLTIASGAVTQISGTTVDGQSPNINDFVLIMNAPVGTGAAGGTTLSTRTSNGLYQVTGNTTNLSVTRATAMTGSNNPSGAYVFVEAGSTWGTGGYVVTTPASSASFTYGSGTIAFTQFTGAGEITAGTGLTKTGNTLAVSLTGGTGITVTGASISVTNSSIGLTQLSATGTPSSTTYLRGDNTWAALTLGSFSISALSAPTGAVSWGGFGLTSLANPASAQDAATKIYVDSAPYHPSARVATLGTETFTVASGTVTQISGTTVDGVSPSVGDRILIKDAPATTGTGSILSAQPGNGIYVITANTTNLSVSRVSDMSSGGSSSTPAGSAVIVEAGSANAVSSWKVSSPSSAAAFTYGTTNIQWTPDVNTGNVLTRSGNTISVASMSTGQAIIGNAGTPTITTLGGDVTVGATGTVMIAAAAVTLAKMANLSANSVIGNTSGSGATPVAVALTTSATGNAIALRDSIGNLAANSLIGNVTTTATAAGTTTLTLSSTGFQQFTGTSTQTVVMPTASTMINGQSFTITNRSTGAVTVNAHDGSLLQTMTGGSQAVFTLISNSGSAGTWDVEYTIAGLVGTVTTASVVTANGFAGTVATATTTPAITLTTSVTGVLKGNGTAISAATAGTDYTSPSSTETQTNKTLTNPTINNYTEGVVAIGNTGTAQTISLTSGTFQTATLTGNCTFTMPTATGGKSFVLLLKTGAGGFTATFTSVKWNSGGAPTITAAASQMDTLSFFSDGTDWYGAATQGFTP